jgi:glycosyltransferase involved in cell wall biosynthesis
MFWKARDPRYDGRQRVLMLMQNSTYPGDPRVVQEAEALASVGHLVTVICPAGTGQTMREQYGNVQVLRYPAPPRAEGPLGYIWEYLYCTAISLAKAVALAARQGFDVIHAANPPDTFVLVALPFRLFGKAFVFDHHDLMPEMYSVRFPGQKGRLIRRPLLWFEGMSCRVADHMITVNESYARTATERHGVPTARITVVRNGPDLRAFNPTTPPLEGLAPEGRQVIMYAGSISVQDGVDSLVRSIGHLVHDLGRKEFVCLVLGSGVALDGLRALANELDVSEHIHFLGFVPRDTVPAHLALADICVAPEPSNTYNDRSTMIKIMEYMAMAKPIVAFDLPEHRFSARDAAVYVTDNDEQAFARALTDLLDDPERRHQLGAAGRLRIEQELSWGHQVPKLLGVYEALTSRGPRRVPPPASLSVRRRDAGPPRHR